MNTTATETTQFKTPLAPKTNVREYLISLVRERKYLGACFILPAIIMWIIYICMQVYPFGEESVLVLDLNGQYVYFFEELKNIIYSDGSLLYSFSRPMGGEFMGIFAYYLSSPFSFIVALFPASMMTEALLLMFLLKTGACGLTFGIYIDATRKRSPAATVLFSSMYALCGYAVVMQHNTMWIDNLILLPIIMLGIENMIKYGRYKMFVFSLMFAIFSNFYIGYMMCIFVAAYFFYYYFASSPEERNPRGEKYHFAKCLGRISLFYAITLAICAALILCTYYSLTFGKTEFTNPNYAFTQKFDWVDMMTKLYFGSYDTVRPEGLPWLYSGMLALVLCPLYFVSPHIKTREKIASGILIVFFLLSFNGSTIDIAWHGFQKPNWLNYRYSFMLCFFIILFAYKAYEKLAETGYRKVIASSAAVMGILLILQKLDYENVNDLTTVWASLAFTAVYLAVMRASAMTSSELRQTATLVLCVICSLELFCAGLLNVIALDDDVVYSSRTSYQSFRERVSPIVEKVQDEDDSFYRMEKTVHRKTNDPYLFDMNGLSGSTSTLNAETIELLNSFGLTSKSHWAKYLGGTPVMDTLFGVKYLICPENENIPLYDYLYSYKKDLKAYKNSYALPIAYGVSEKVEDLDLSKENEFYSPFDRMNALVSTMLGEEETVKVFKAEEDVTVSTLNLKDSTIASHTKYMPLNPDSVASVTYTINVTDEDTLYCYFPSDYTRECKFYVNNESKGTYYGNETYRIIELGEFTPGETITVTLELSDDVLYIRENVNFFCYCDSETFKEYMPLLSESGYDIEKHTESSFSGKINVSEGDELIFTTIAYDEGWKIYVDGKKVEPVKVIGGLLAFKAEAGEHTLKMKYRPDCLTLGIILQVIGIAAFAAVWVVDSLQRKKLIALGREIYFIPDINDDPCTPDEACFDMEKGDSL